MGLREVGLAAAAASARCGCVGGSGQVTVATLQVRLHVALLAGRVVTVGTLEGLLPGVCADVLLQRGRVEENLSAKLAHVLGTVGAGGEAQEGKLSVGGISGVQGVLLPLLLGLQPSASQGHLHKAQPAHHAHAHTHALEERNTAVRTPSTPPTHTLQLG